MRRTLHYKEKAVMVQKHSEKSTCSNNNRTGCEATKLLFVMKKNTLTGVYRRIELVFSNVSADSQNWIKKQEFVLVSLHGD